MSALTVLMPVYNAERYLGVAIESILAQSFRDFTFLIIDDASTDRSREIVESYGDSRIRFLRNRVNIGISATLNRGIEAADTELIARMDADDRSHPHRLMKQHGFMFSHPDCAMVSTLTTDISESGELLGRNRLEPDHFYFSLTFYCWIYHPTAMYRRSVIRELGLYPPGLAEDYRLWCRLIRHYRFATLPEFLLDHRMSGQSTCNVVHRRGYAEAEMAQIIDNLRHFMGNAYDIPPDWIECYRNNLEPLLAQGKVRRIAACIRELDRIAEKVASTPNVNNEPSQVRRAAAEKRSRILQSFVRRLNWPGKIALLMETGSFSILRQLLAQGFRGRMRWRARPRKTCESI